MELSRSLLKEFAEVTAVKSTTEKPTYLRGTITSSGTAKYVRIDGSESLTPIGEIVDAKVGDRVLVSIENHQATVVGNITKPPSAYKEEEAIAKSKEAKEEVNTALEKAETAHTLAQSAGDKADAAVVDATNASTIANQAKQDASEALTAAQNASEESAQAISAAQSASQNAETARQEAAAAQTSVAAAQGEVTRINGIITEVKSDITTAEENIATQAAQTQAIKETLSVDYAKKTEVSDVQASLTTEISKKVGELQTTIADIYTAKTESVKMEGRLQSQITQTATQSSEIMSRVETLEADTAVAQQNVNDALAKSKAAQEAALQAQNDAAASQTAADTAKADAATALEKANTATQNAATATATATEADRKLALARTDLDEARTNLENTMTRVDATEADILDAQNKVTAAQAAVTQAQEDAAEATLAANNAQAAAIQAQNDATEAQTAATNAQLKADNAKTAADTAQANALKAQQDVAALTSRVTTAETNITKNADAIKLSATRTEEIGNLLVNDYYTKSQTDAAIKVQADGITQHVSSTYAVKTNTIKSSVEEFYQSTSPTALSGGTWSTTQPTWTQGKYIWRRTKNTYGNDVVSYSPSTNGVCITGNTGATGANGQNGKGVSSYSVTYQAGTSGTTAPTGTWTSSIPSVPQGQYLWTKMVITYTDSTSTTSYSVSYIPVNGKNGATGATGPTGPAGNGVSAIVAEFYLSTSKTTQTGGSWSTTQPTWSPGKYVWTRNKITYTNGSTAYTSPQCSSEWEAVNRVESGGTNYIYGKYIRNNGISNYTFSDETGKGSGTITGAVGWLGKGIVFDRNDIPIYAGESMYIGLTVKTNMNCNYAFDVNNVRLDGQGTGNDFDDVSKRTSQTGTLTANTWQRVYVIFTAGSPIRNNGSIFGVYTSNSGDTINIEFKEVTMKKSNIPVSYSSPTELMDKNTQNAQDTASNAKSTADDAVSRVTTAESTIKQLANAIAMLVTDENGASLMTQTSTGWTFNMGAINDSLEKAVKNIGDLTTSMNQANITINNLNRLANDLSKKTAYINMTTDENNAPCIELGKVGNAFKLRITNTSVDFIEGSSKIAYVSNQSLFIETAIIKSELQIGEKRGFIWKTRSNGNMGIRWFG